MRKIKELTNKIHAQQNQLIELIKDISWSLGFEYITGEGFKNFLIKNKRLTI